MLTMPKKIAMFFLIVVCTVVQPIWASHLYQPIEAYSQKPVLKVGVDRNAPPIEFEVNGNPKGFNIDIIQELSKKVEYNFEFVFMEWSDVLLAVQNGTLDIMFATKTEERQLLYDFTQSVNNISWRIVVREDILGISDLNSLKGKTVAAVKDFAEYEYLIENYPEIIVIKVNSTENGLDLLKSGSVFAFFGQKHLILYEIQNHDFATLKLIGEEYPYKEFCLAVKKGRTDLLQSLNQGLTAMFNDGSYDKIYEIWFGRNPNQNIKQILQYMGFILIVSGLIVTWVIIWNRRLKREVDANVKKFMDTYNFFRNLIEDLSYPVAIVKRFGDLVYVNPHYTKVTGYDLEEIKTQDMYFEKLYPDPIYRKEVRNEWNKLQREPEKYVDKMYEFRIQTKNNQTRLFQFKIAIMDNEDIYVIMNDFTEHYELEEKRRQIEKIETASLVASGIGHDFNNLLTSIASLINLIELEQQNAESKETFQLLQETINRGKTITKELMEFSRNEPLRKELTNINNLIKQVIEQDFFKEHARIVLNSEEHIPNIFVDQTKIIRVIDNIIRNAIEVSGSNDIIEVRIKNDEPNVVIEIQDHGKGIPESLKANLFTPYFTTKSHGTGLGLATSYSIVKNHGGSLSFESKEGLGTTFFIKLPKVNL